MLRYERLAEDATRVALQEKEIRLKKLAEELRQREIQARQKLASAVESLELLKSHEGQGGGQPPTLMSPASAISTPRPQALPNLPKMELIDRNRKSYLSDAITTDDEVI